MVTSKFWACDSTLTRSPGFQGNLPVEPKIIDFVSLFLTYEFFEIIFEQRNIDESRYFRSQLWIPTSPDGIKKFLALYLLTRIITKPALSQYWSTDLLLRTSVLITLYRENRRWIFNLFTLLATLFLILKILTDMFCARCDQFLSIWLIRLNLYIYHQSRYLSIYRWKTANLERSVNLQAVHSL